MKPVVVYTSPSCGYCVRAKELLKRRGIPFEEILLGWNDHEAREELNRRSGMRTMPQIFIGGELVGGYRELDSLDRSGELARKVQS